MENVKILRYEIMESLVQTEDEDLMENIKTMLEEKETATRNWMTERALRAEENLKNGRFHTFEEAKAKLDERFGK